MKFIHLSDLHLGKRVNEFSMIEDQKYILEEILGVIREEQPLAVIIAGDVYDKPVPPSDAVQLFDDFISRLEDMKTDVFIISGNHDSAERLSFGSRIMDKRGIHFAGGYDGTTHMFTLEDEHGPVNIYMLPFLKPVHVRQAFAEEEGVPEIASFNDAVAYAVKRMDVDVSERNVLIAHQFCTGSTTSDSEEISVGGVDNVDAEAFGPFDYIALGHLHGPQEPVPGRMRYSGSPLKYSFSEVNQKKAVTVVELGEKKDGVCDLIIRTPELVPLRDMQDLKDTFSKLTDKNYYSHIKCDDYMRIILTDEEDVIGAHASLRAIYPYMMVLDYDNTRSRNAAIMPDASDTGKMSPLEIFGRLYESQNGKPMDEEQTALISGLMEKIWSEEE